MNVEVLTFYNKTNAQQPIRRSFTCLSVTMVNILDDFTQFHVNMLTIDRQIPRRISTSGDQ